MAFPPLGSPLLILMYHHVASPPPSAKVRGLYITPTQLDWQVRQLKQAGFKFVNFRILAERQMASRKQEPSSPEVILTFDDGYTNNYHSAFPIFQRHQITATIYPVVGSIGKHQVIWEENDAQTPVDLMNSEQIQEMHDAGIEFGSHFWDHIHADRQDAATIKTQLTQSKTELERIIGVPVVSVAYPYGAYNQTVLDAAAQVGYSYGVTTVSGWNGKETSCVELRRFSVTGNKWYHPLQFKRRLRKEFLAGFSRFN